MAGAPVFRNPQLDGSSFVWEAGPVGVVLCHGFTATSTEVRPLANALFEEGYSISAPLLPGHGTTPKDCNRFKWQDWYEAFERSYQQLAAKCERVVVGGESTGALLALYHASQNPEDMAILCYSPALKLRIPPVKAFFLSLLVPFLTSIPKSPSADDNLWKGYGVNPLKAAAQLLKLQKVVNPSLGKIKQPILIIQGKLDPTVHPEAPQFIYNQVSSTLKQLHWLENSTHCVILDKERTQAARLSIEFLGDIRPTAQK
jgi:carboxylesterase